MWFYIKLAGKCELHSAFQLTKKQLVKNSPSIIYILEATWAVHLQP